MRHDAAEALHELMRLLPYLSHNTSLNPRNSLVRQQSVPACCENYMHCYWMSSVFSIKAKVHMLGDLSGGISLTDIITF